MCIQFKMAPSALLLLSICLFALTGAFASPCAHRNYGNGATVCVCNAAHCDDVKPIRKTAKGVVTSFVSSKAGDRFAQKHFPFAKHPSTHVAPTISVTIDHRVKYQKIIGFGGTFTDTSGINIASLPKKVQARLMMDYFSKDGIEYTVGRIPMAGCDASTRPYSYDDHANDETLSKFALAPEDFKYKLPYLRIAQKVSPHKVNYFGSPWSSPAWMKDNGQFKNGGFLKGAPGGKYYKMFAHYHVRFIQEYEKNNVSIWGLTVENEPGAGYIPQFPWNSLGLNATLERDFTKLDLGPALHAHGYTKDKLKVMIHDDQLPNIKDFSHTVLSDPEAAKYVSGIAFHWYQNSHGNRRDLDWLMHHFKNEYFILATEANEGWGGHQKHVSLGNWATFNRYADDIINDLNHFTTGWIDWNIAVDLQGGPNWVNNLVDATIIVNATSGEYYKQPHFYALGHFSKFLVPNSVRVHHHAKTTDKNLLVTVFQRPDGGTVLTLLNKNPHAVILQVSDPQNGHLDVTVKADSLETLLWY